DTHVELLVANEAEAFAVLDDDVAAVLLYPQRVQIAAERFDLDHRLGGLGRLDLDPACGKSDTQLRRLGSGELVPHFDRRPFRSWSSTNRGGLGSRRSTLISRCPNSDGKNVMPSSSFQLWPNPVRRLPMREVAAVERPRANALTIHVFTETPSRDAAASRDAFSELGKRRVIRAVKPSSPCGGGAASSPSTYTSEGSCPASRTSTCPDGSSELTSSAASESTSSSRSPSVDERAWLSRSAAAATCSSPRLASEASSPRSAST